MKADLQENRMRRYLLGDLPEAEAASVEQAYFADDQKFEQMWEIESNLVEGYVRGRLPSNVREKFEGHYLASPVHRQRVAVARNLIEMAARSSAVATLSAQKVTLQSRLFEMLRFSPAKWRLAATAAVLLLAAGSLRLIIDRVHWRNEMAQLRAESEVLRSREQALADQIAAAQGKSDELLAELERLRAERNGVEQQPAQPATEQIAPRGPAPRQTVFSALLSPVHIRGGGNPHLLTIPLKTDVVRLRMKTDREDTRRYQVSVRGTEGGQVWRQRAIKPHLDGANAVITVHVPGDRLEFGDYILTLSAATSTGTREEIYSYFFRIIRK
jgi:hypothetical protein